MTTKAHTTKPTVTTAPAGASSRVKRTNKRGDTRGLHGKGKGLNVHAGIQPDKSTKLFKVKWAQNTKFKTKPELQKRIQEFFEVCAHDGRHPTVLGACLYMGISHETWYAWKKGEGENAKIFSDTIKMADQLMEDFTSQRLLDPSVKNQTGAIFYAKNKHNWVDKKEIDLKDERKLVVLDL